MQNRRTFLKKILFFSLFFSFKLKANTNLENINKDFAGNVFTDNAFKNLYGKSGDQSFIDLLKWKFSANLKKAIKDKEKYQLKVLKNNTILQSKEDYICWCGHATFLIQINGKKILTDPCLTAPPTMDRLTKLPFKIKDIKPDYLLISHGHFDHLDSDTLEYFKKVEALTPLNMTNLIKDINIDIHTQEAGWYQKYKLAEDFEIIFLPAHHWHRRSLADRDEILWG